MAKPVSRVEQYRNRLNALRNVRSTWESHWRDLASNFLPRRAQFYGSEHNNGAKVNSSIINSKPLQANRSLAAGMSAGNTSPARPWFRFSPPTTALNEDPEVRKWCDDIEETVREAISKSNIYQVLASLYQDISVFGVAAIYIEEDPESDSGLRAYVFPIGTYCLATSSKQRVDTIYREFKWSVAQVVSEFGRDKCSQRVRQLYDEGHIDQDVELIHVIEPNRERDEKRKDYRGKPWRSCWLEKSVSATGDQFLRESGYEEFPVMAPRWDVTGNDVYGRSPGMDALGDAKALQLLEKRKLQMVDKIVTPPVNVPSSMRHAGVSLLPNAHNFTDGISQGAKIEPAITVPPGAVEVAEASIARYEERIQDIFYANLWLMMSQTDRRQITATEVDERREEKMLQLGPVLERLQDELLKPMIDRVFGILLRRGEIPPAPQAIRGANLRVEYISIMAQAQKRLSTAGIERLAGFVGNLVAVVPTAIDKLNAEQMIDEYAIAEGVKSNLVRSDEEVDQIRAQRQEQAKAAQALDSMTTAAQGAKTLSETDMEGNTALSQILGAMGAPSSGLA